MTEKTVKFRLNGNDAEVTGPPTMPLLYALRNDLDHKATRFGCGTGNCGACTVTLDGVAVTSCDLPIEAVDGKSVGTVEGLVAADHPLIEALLRNQAGQCGYCLPGIAIRAASLIDAGHSAEDIQQALDANLCRCGAHPRILEAIAEVANNG